MKSSRPTRPLTCLTVSQRREILRAVSRPSKRKHLVISKRSARKFRLLMFSGPAEEPAKGPGLYFMDSSSAAAECVTLMAAGGFVVHAFPTGQGNIIGNPILPVVKITGEPADHAHDVGAHRCGCHWNSYARTDDGSGWRQVDRHARQNGQWPNDGSRSAWPQRVRDDQVVSERVDVDRLLAGLRRSC